MGKRQVIFIFFAVALSFSAAYAQNELPNIVLIVADDLGYGDLHSYGGDDIQTPNIDRLGTEGVRFANFYSNAPECTPTRVGLLTGRYQQRVGGLECAIGLGNIGRYEESLKLSDQGLLGLPVEFNVLPSILKKKGYNTALIGKWHLGDGKQFRPKSHGFDYSIGPLGGGVDYFHHTEPVGIFLGTKMEGEYDLYRNDELHNREGYYMTDLISDESVAWLNIQSSDKPFFLYVPYTAPHEPIQGPDDYQPQKLTTDVWGKGSRDEYHAMIEEMDRGIGRILAKLDEKGFTKNTLVIFTSDNGPTTKGSTGPFSGNKGHVFEGGIRVPCVARWPGKIKAGVASDQVALTMDLTASIAALLKAPTPKPLDGIDILGHVINEREDFPRTLFWRIKRGGNIRKAVRDNNMKYIHVIADGKISEYLFNLTSDPAEKNNLVDKDRKGRERLKGLLDAWEKDVQPERYH